MKKAHLADPARPFVLMQIIWCAQKLSDRGEINLALYRLRHGFPAKFEEMLRERPRLRRMA